MVPLKRCGTLLRLAFVLVVIALIGTACGAPTNTIQQGAQNPTSASAPADATTASAAPAAATAQGNAAPSGEAPQGVLTASVEQQASWVRNFNPFLAQGSSRWPTRAGVYEPMLIYNTIKAEYVNWLASDYKWSSDNKTLTFTTRSNVKWSDGQPFTAKDVAFTFNLMKKVKGLDLDGVWSFLSDVKATDDSTVEFTFQNVYTPGLVYIGQQPIVPEHIWKDVPDPLTFTNENPVATGPFTVVKTFQNQIYELDRNPNYWQAGKPYITGLRFPTYPGNDQANLATVNGEVDWAGNFIPDIQNVYVSKDPNHHYWFPAVGGTVMLYANTTKKPFDDPNVRKAISMALNRDQIVKVAMYDYTHPSDATGLSDAYQSWKNADAVNAGDWVKQDLNKAKELLDAAGLKAGADGMRTMPDGTPLKYDLNVVTGWSDWVSSCQIMSQNLKQLGLDVSVKTYDFSAWFEKVQKGEFDLSIGWSSAGPTPFNFYRGQMSSTTAKPVGETANENWHRYSNPEADKLLQQFATTSDVNEQKQISNQLQTLFVQNAPAIPIFPGPSWGEYNTTRFTGFPDKDNAYGLLTPNNPPEYLLVMTEIKPK